MKKLFNTLSVLAIVISVVALGIGLVGNQSALRGSTSDNWNVGGNLVVDGTGTITGATTLTGAVGTGALTSSSITNSGTLTQTGTSTMSQPVLISHTESRLQIGDTSDGVGSGCLILGDSGSATATPVYITATGATITASTTAPAICH
jgi:hypothetical protein